MYGKQLGHPHHQPPLLQLLDSMWLLMKSMPVSWEMVDQYVSKSSVRSPCWKKTFDLRHRPLPRLHRVCFCLFDLNCKTAASIQRNDSLLYSPCYVSGSLVQWGTLREAFVIKQVVDCRDSLVGTFLDRSQVSMHIIFHHHPSSPSIDMDPVVRLLCGVESLTSKEKLPTFIERISGNTEAR